MTRFETGAGSTQAKHTWSDLVEIAGGRVRSSHLAAWFRLGYIREPQAPRSVARRYTDLHLAAVLVLDALAVAGVDFKHAAAAVEETVEYVQAEVRTRPLLTIYHRDGTVRREGRSTVDYHRGPMTTINVAEIYRRLEDAQR